jgi:hypothetical protein
MSRADFLLFLVAVVVLAAPGWRGAGYTYVWTAALVIGLLIASVPVIRVGIARPTMALAFLVAMNLAWWLFYLLRFLQHESGGAGGALQPVVGAASGWVVLLLLTAVYELLIFLGAWRAREERRVCGAGFAGLAVQLGAVAFILGQLV